MSLAQKVNEFIDKEIKDSHQRFMQSISTDENSDYRRGFLAGELFSRLQLKLSVRDMEQKYI